MSASKYVWSIVILAAIGCTPRTPVATSSSTPSTPATPATSAPPANPAPPATPAASPVTPAAQPATPAIPGLSGIPGAADAATQVPTPGTEQVKAKAGVGIKGQSLQEHTGVFVEPAKAFFRVEQKVVFDVQIPKGMQLFQASEGRLPKSEAEFMTKIIAEGQIILPKLPQGHKYVYNVEAGELMVEKPKK